MCAAWAIRPTPLVSPAASTAPKQSRRPLRLPKRQGNAGQTSHRTQEEALGADLRRDRDALGEEAGGQNLVALHPRGVGAFAEGHRNAHRGLDTAVEREGLIEQRHGAPPRRRS